MPIDEYMNCWEFKKCGREEGGINARELGVCPAYNLGEGRFCARVDKTLCKGEQQGNYVNKSLDCFKCDFYNSEHYDKKRLIEEFHNADFGKPADFWNKSD